MKDDNVKPRPGSSEHAAKLLRIDDVAMMLRVSKRSAWRLVAAGELIVVRVGRSVRIPATAVETFIEKGGTK